MGRTTDISGAMQQICGDLALCSMWSFFWCFYYQVRSNISFISVLNSWIMFSAILILLTFQLHFILINFNCGSVSFGIHGVQATASIIDDNPQCILQSMSDTFRHKQCRSTLDHVAYEYNQCVAHKEKSMLLWMALACVVCVVLHVIFVWCSDSIMLRLHYASERNYVRHTALQSKIRSFYRKVSIDTVAQMRRTVDRMSYQHNDKQLLPTEIRNIIVQMICSPLPECEDCGEIICEHIPQRSNICVDNMELRRMRRACVAAKCIVTFELACVYAVCVAMIAGALYCVYWFTSNETLLFISMTIAAKVCHTLLRSFYI